MKAQALPYRLVPIEETNALRVVGVVRAGSDLYEAATRDDRYPICEDAEGHLYQLLFQGKVHQTTALSRAVKAVREWVDPSSGKKPRRTPSSRTAAASGAGGRLPLRERMQAAKKPSRGGKDVPVTVVAPKSGKSGRSHAAKPAATKPRVAPSGSSSARFPSGETECCPIDAESEEVCACDEEACDHSTVAYYPDAASSLVSAEEVGVEAAKEGTGRFSFTYREQDAAEA